MNAPDNSLSLTLDKLLPEFYKQYNLGPDGGLQDPKVKIEFTRHFYYFIPNWDERRRAVERHDMHHIITGYPSTIKGEAEICAWEIASGCRNYWAAWLLDMQGMGLFWFYPVVTFKAFIRGQRSANLYHDTIPIEEARKLTSADLRDQLHIPAIDEKLKVTFSDLLHFTGWLAWSNLFALASLVITPVIVLYNIYLFSRLLLFTKRTR